jgi:hypothetical protein
MRTLLASVAVLVVIVVPARADRPVTDAERTRLVAAVAPQGCSGGKPQIILKTDRRNVILELGLRGKFQAKSSGWDENRTFLEGDVLEVTVRNGRWVLTHAPAGPRPAPPPPGTISRPRSDGVTGYVTSSHGAATPLRDGVTGHLAGNQPVRSRQAIVSLRFSNGLGGQICRRASLRNTPTACACWSWSVLAVPS